MKKATQSFSPDATHGWVLTYVDRKSIGGDGLCRPSVGGVGAVPVFRKRKDALAWYATQNNGAKISPSHKIRRCVVRLAVER